MFHYDICNEADKEVFEKQCRALEEHIPNISKGKLLEDVDSSETQFYCIGAKKISVHNDLYIGSIYVDSDVDLQPYFIYEVVKSAVDEMDYMSLLASEAPRDEFEPEIQKICSLIKLHNTTEEIAELLAEVFNKAFSASDTPDMFLDCANKIKTELKKTDGGTV